MCYHFPLLWCMWRCLWLCAGPYCMCNWRKLTKLSTNLKRSISVQNSLTKLYPRHLLIWRSLISLHFEYLQKFFSLLYSWRLRAMLIVLLYLNCLEDTNTQHDMCLIKFDYMNTYLNRLRHRKICQRLTNSRLMHRN